MSRQFLRDIEVIIGNSESANVPDALRVTKLRVEFDIQKDILSTPTRSRISIYNLNEDSRSRIEDKFNKIIVNAGYTGNLKLLFSGDILYVFHRYTGKDVITDIYAADGNFSYLTSFFSRSYGQTTTYKKIIDDVIDSFDGVNRGTIKDIPDSENSQFGSSFFDLSHNVLTRVTNSLDLIWYIESGEINIFPSNEVIREEPIEFSADNGMIGSPTVTEIGINLQVLLRPDLLPGANFKVLSRSPNIAIGNYFLKGFTPTKGTGTYRVQRLVHRGDTRGQNWLTFIEGFLVI